MPNADPYEAWKRWRAKASVPDGFAERVMSMLRRQEQLQRLRPAPAWARLFESTAFRVAVGSLACATGVLRILQVVALFVVEQSTR